MVPYIGKNIDEKTIKKVKDTVLKPGEKLEAIFEGYTNYSFTDMYYPKCILVVTNKNLILGNLGILVKDAIRFDYDNITRVEGEPSLIDLIKSLFGRLYEINSIGISISGYDNFGVRKEGSSLYMRVQISGRDAPIALEIIQKRIHQKVDQSTMSPLLLFYYLAILCIAIGTIGAILFNSLFSFVLMGIGIVALLWVNILSKK